MVFTYDGSLRYLTTMINIRQARVIFIALLLMAHYAYTNIYFFPPDQSISIHGSSDNPNTNTIILDPIATDDAAPEASLPEHHVPLPWDPPDSLTSNNQTEIWFDAIDTNGNRGYVADPTLFRRLVLQWHRQHENATYWDRLRLYQSHLQLDNKTSLTMDNICSITEKNGGGGELRDEGITMLTEYLKVDYETPILRKGCMESPPLRHERPKLFCGIYTHNPARDSTRLAALSYGWKCDGFLAFSTVTIPSLGMVGILHRGEEAYKNMVQKTRSIWSYIATHYLDQFDYFHIGGDDMHVIVENMRSLLLEHESEPIDAREEGRIFGQLASKGSQALFLRGGAGYTIDRIGLKKLHEYMPKCSTKVHKPAEDNIVTMCSRKVGLVLGDNRDSCTSQQRSHSMHPGVLSVARGISTSEFDEQLKFWGLLPHPAEKTVKVGMKIGFEAASNHSVTFHQLRYHSWFVRHHALIYRACPANTILGKLANRTDDSITEGGA